MTAAPLDPNEAFVRTLFEALNRRNLEELVSFYAPEAALAFRAERGGLNKAPVRKAARARPQSLQGQAAILDYYRWLLFDRWPDTEFELDQVSRRDEATWVAAWHRESQDQGTLDEGEEHFVLHEARFTEHTSAFPVPPEGVIHPNLTSNTGDSAPEAEQPGPPEPARPADATPAPAAAGAPLAWPYGKCLVGASLAGPDPDALPATDIFRPVEVTLQTARVEAVKLPFDAPPESVAALLQRNPNLFVLVSVYRELRPPGETPEAYVAATAPLIAPLYQAGVRYFELQSQPGATFNVWSALFGSIRALAEWFVAVRAALTAQFPEARLGFPAIQPPYDPSWATDTARFLAEADPAVQAADWVGVPCTWASPDQREAPDGGRLYLRYRERYPDKLLFITEFGNRGSAPDPAAAAADYLSYYRSLRSLPNLGAAFADVLLGQTPPSPLAWATPAGVPGVLAQALGARRWSEAGDPPENFAGFATNDRPEGKDELGYDDYARAFVRVLSNPDTKTPLTIGIYGSWGVGKSFLMHRIRAFVEEVQQANDQARRARPLGQRLWDGLKRLRPVRRPALAPGPAPAGALASARRRLAAPLVKLFTRPPSHAVDFHCVEFNAWVYSGSENLWAGLITHLYNEVEKYLGTRRTVPFRFSQNAQRAARKTVWLLALYGLLGFALSVLLDLEQIQASVETLGAALTTVAGAVALGGTLAAALAALPPLLNALRDLANSLTLARSEQLAALASRRDFRDKIGFMADIKDEIRMIRRLLDQGRDGVRTRLVIFIDDLDRCEPKKAVEVLEAIMLLLADEDGMPFVVVLGIDARIVVKAVEERYGKVLTEAGISGYEYLDKLVQIPFRIPPPPSTALANYVASLLWRSPEERLAEEARVAEAAQRAARRSAGAMPGAALEGQASLPAGAARERHLPSAVAEASQGAGGDAPSGTILVDGASRPLRRLAAAAEAPAPPPVPEVTFLPDEREAFEAYAKGDHLSPNPRRVKRILNIYRIVRLLNPAATAAQRQQMIKWVVLTEQWPYRTAWLMQAAEDDAQRAQAERRLTDGDGLSAVYELVLADVGARDAQPFASLDADPDLFGSFIAAVPAITVADLRWLRPYTFNLNPALQGEVVKAVARKATGLTAA